VTVSYLADATSVPPLPVTHSPGLAVRMPFTSRAVGTTLGQTLSECGVAIDGADLDGGWNRVTRWSR